VKTTAVQALRVRWCSPFTSIHNAMPSSGAHPSHHFITQCCTLVLTLLISS